MADKDKSASFDFAGTHTVINEHKRIEYDLSNRHTNETLMQLSKLDDTTTQEKWKSMFQG